MAKTGRKAKHYVTSWGETIIGLSRRPKDGRWRIVGTQETFTEPDERQAILEYRRRQAQERREVVGFPLQVSLEVLRDLETDHQARTQEFSTLDELPVSLLKSGLLGTEIRVPADAVWSTLRDLM